VSNLETKIMEMGKCPVCRGTTKQPDGRECRNCGGQTMTLRATGKVPLRKDGTPCTHKFGSFSSGRRELEAMLSSLLSKVVAAEEALK
jgi:hypothetical protein